VRKVCADTLVTRRSRNPSRASENEATGREGDSRKETARGDKGAMQASKEERSKLGRQEWAKQAQTQTAKGEGGRRKRGQGSNASLRGGAKRTREQGEAKQARTQTSWDSYSYKRGSEEERSKRGRPEKQRKLGQLLRQGREQGGAEQASLSEEQR